MKLDQYMMATVSDLRRRGDAAVEEFRDAFGKVTAARREQLSATYNGVTEKEHVFIRAVNAEQDSALHPTTQKAFDDLMACVNDALVACGAKRK